MLQGHYRSFVLCHISQQNHRNRDQHKKNENKRQKPYTEADERRARRHKHCDHVYLHVITELFVWLNKLNSLNCKKRFKGRDNHIIHIHA